MKIMVFGIGNFGASLVMLLTEMGHEVIAVDRSQEKVDLIKDQVVHAICLDATSLPALRTLPLRDTDIAIVCIGENEGASILTTANLKTLGMSRVISRSISPTHDTVLEAMGITEILHPEQDAAERLAKKLNLRTAIETFDLDPTHSVVELNLPAGFVGKTVAELDLRNRYNLNIVTLIRQRMKRNLLGINRVVRVAEGVVKPETRFESGDILVVFGSNEDVENMCREETD